MVRLVAVIATAFTIVTGIAVARDQYQSYIPNGDQTFGGNSTSCQTCHVGTSGGTLNAFGVDVETNLKGGVLDWGALSQFDSDGDGYSNGYELGDPNGEWRPGALKPYGTFTNPAKAQSDTPLAIQRVQVPTSWAVIKALFR